MIPGRAAFYWPRFGGAGVERAIGLAADTRHAETGYGLGWDVETLPLAGQSSPMAGHGSTRDFIGATTSFMTFPERGIVVAVMSNISFADTKSIALNIAQAFAEQKR